MIAAFMFFAWIAIGSIFLGQRAPDDELSAPGAILIGSGITSFALAIVTYLGLVVTGTTVVMIACGVISIARYKTASRIVGEVLATYARSSRSRAVTLAGVIVTLTMWLTAIAPPRTADAMRYHLAHVRQIVQDGRWESIPDYHYGLPFAWSLNYLPFELTGLPQGSQILGLLLFAFFIACAVLGMRKAGVSDVATIAAMVLMLHPASIRAFTEPGADAYTMFVVLTIGVLFLRHWSFNSRDIALLGFVSWIGIGSRYQLIAVAIAATVCVIASYKGKPHRFGAAWAYSGGAIGAVVLASPFYLMNFRASGNPVWPLMIGAPTANSSFADLAAYYYSHSLMGSFEPAFVVSSVAKLFTTWFLFPLPILIVVAIVLPLIVKHTGARLLGAFGLIFLAEWFIMQPLLYPKFSLMMLPVAVLCAGLLFERVLADRDWLSTVLHAVSVAAALGLTAVAPYVNRDAIQYAVKPDAAYHRYTWFYQTYDWVNHNTPRDARFLVIVQSAQSYYLERKYRRADPWLSGVVDWRNVSTAHALDSVMNHGGYRYLLYDNYDWQSFVGGPGMMKAISEAAQSGMLRKVASFEDTLYTSRFRRTYETTTVDLFERVTSSSRR
jgi:hypothetical protein